MPQAPHALTSIDVSDPRLYQDDAWRAPFARLRRDDPVHYCEASPFGPYWAVTRYDMRDLRFEITGPPQRLYSNFIRGIRSLRI